MGFSGSEDVFFDTLENIFLGVKPEGRSGYINLIKIKSAYFDKFFRLLRKKIEEFTPEFPEFREELYDKLYTFFTRYFSRGGTPYFKKTPYYREIYDRIYTDERDVLMFWKTNMLYYVKTDNIFRSMEVEIGGVRFFFDVSELEYKKGWEKKEPVFEIKAIDKDKAQITLKVKYSERGKKNNLKKLSEEIIRYFPEIGVEAIRKAISTFKRQTEIDYFICKDMRTFLKEQFDMWLFGYTKNFGEEFHPVRLKQLGILRTIAYFIIDFISAFEDELLKIWKKPRFVLNASYVITLDRISERPSGKKIIREIIDHPNFMYQLGEWKELEFIDDKLAAEIPELILSGNLPEKLKRLPIDTRYFKDIEIKILSLFDNLDEALDGRLIKSENWQALNTLLNRYAGRIKMIYIDPPFNTGKNEFTMYMNKFLDAAWVTMMENRLSLAKELLTEDGAIFVRIDYHGSHYIRFLMDEIFGAENFRNEIILKRAGISQSFMYKRFNPATDTLYFYAKSDATSIKPVKLKKDPSKIKWTPMHIHKENKNCNVIYIKGEKFIAPAGRHFPSQKLVDRLLAEGRIKIVEKEYTDVFGNKHNRIPYYLPKDFELADSNWTDIPGYSAIWKFPTENSEQLLERVIFTSTDENDTVMDFFLGSGTTVAVAHKMGRKWIGIEMGEHIFSVVLPRMKKVLFGDKRGVGKKYAPKGGFFKYYTLEQYEDILRRAEYTPDTPLKGVAFDSIYKYIFMRDKKLTGTSEIGKGRGMPVFKPRTLYKNIDMAETLANLLGSDIQSIEKGYVILTDGNRYRLNPPDFMLIKPLIWW